MGFALERMCAKMALVGMLWCDVSSHGRQCTGQYHAVRKGGGTLAFVPVSYTHLTLPTTPYV